MAKFCGRCGSPLNEDGSCPKCNSDIINKTKKRKAWPALLGFILLCIIVAGVVYANHTGLIMIFPSNISRQEKDSSVTRLNNQKDEHNSIRTSGDLPNNSQETRNQYEKKEVDYYSNVSALNSYGLATLDEFEYGKNSNYLELNENNIGIVSALELDLDNNNNNELLTVSLMPNTTGGAYIMPELFSNKSQIAPVGQAKLQITELPTLRLGNQWSRMFVFVSNGYLFITEDTWSMGAYDAGSRYSDIYVYSLNLNGISLYRHLYCYNNNWDAAVGETVTNLSFQLNKNADKVWEEWDALKNKAYPSLKQIAIDLGFDKYFCTQSEFVETDWITSNYLYEDGIFDNSSDTLLSTFDSYTEASMANGEYFGLITYRATDKTNLRSKIS